MPSQRMGSLSISTGWFLTVLLVDDEASSLAVDIACAMDGEEDVTALATTFDRGATVHRQSRTACDTRVRAKAWVSTTLEKKEPPRVLEDQASSTPRLKESLRRAGDTHTYA